MMKMHWTVDNPDGENLHAFIVYTTIILTVAAVVDGQEIELHFIQLLSASFLAYRDNIFPL